MSARLTVRLLAATVTALLIGGCATGYQSQGFKGGYSDTQVAENIFVVSFKGNGYTSAERAEDFALLRSAHVAVDHGFSYFVIVSDQNSTSTSAYTTPTTTTASATVVGNTAYGSATTIGGQTYIIAKPRTRNTIVCLKEKPSSGFYYDAAIVIRSLDEKYGIAPTSKP